MTFSACFTVIDMTVIIVLVYIIVFLLKFVMLLYNCDVNGVHAIDCLGMDLTNTIDGF